MIDSKLLETNFDDTLQNLRRRDPNFDLSLLRSLSFERKALVGVLQELQEKRNRINKGMRGASPDEISAKRDEMKALSMEAKAKEEELRHTENRLHDALLATPNIPRECVPQGVDESDNVEVKKVGEPTTFDFVAKDHVELGESLGLLDFERAAKVSGSRFVFLKGVGARLNRAIANYMIDFHAKEGDLELNPPLLVRGSAAEGVGQLPKFEEGMFKTRRGDDQLYLIPTAEVPVTNYYANEILEESSLPMRFFAYSQCFRSEAGSAGRDTRGMIRQHQFEKIEMVRFATPDQADAEHQNMVDRASRILSDFELPHRIVELCTGDLSFSAERCFDLEVWLPSQNTYREISSCSTFGSYQARRAKIRFRPAAAPGSKKKTKAQPLVTLNGSGLAVGRTLVAILENHQQADGSIQIPRVLQPYMGGQSVIEKTSD